MWLWILSALLVILAWVGWWFLGPAFHIPFWVPCAITGLVILGVLGIIIFRRIRAARAARALEKAIAQQAQEQALAAKPERVAEINELHRQIQAGINALKNSKLANGKSGADALYSLPWYVMVGPPGAGKTTALRHSGLVFPYLDPTGGGVRGVGGTRNCDWWFTNEAILLDTAGRYTTESDDHDEWMAFLEQLLKYRAEKPLNGVVIAVSISELLDASDDQIQDTGRKIRARIDEMQTTLKEVLPVYVLFTKVDLIAGFSEFFGDLKKSERGQAWGATIRLDTDKREPGKLFDGEFDTLVERLHTRGLKRMALERNREVKEKVYQFPLEFAAIRRSLSDFLATAFAPTAGQASPILRGFYFTSGVQEGKPLDRVVGAMGRAFGLRGSVNEDAAAPVESKSFFLRDVFMGVVFPDQVLASRTEAEIRRIRRERILFAVAAAFIALLFMIPSIISFWNNRQLVKETAAISDGAKNVDWQGQGSAIDKVEKLDKLRDRVELLYVNKEKGPPMGYGFPMYQGDKLYVATRDQYVDSLRRGFVLPTRDALADKLNRATGDKYLEDYNNLKTYLLLDDKIHLQDNGDWEKGRLTQAWVEVLRRSTNEPEADLKAKVAPHVAFYVDLLRNNEISGEKLDKPLIDKTRDRLTRVPDATRYYDQFVTVLIDQKYDESGPASDTNLKYPPITLQNIFTDRPEVLTRVRSSLKDRQNKWFEVRGPYTFKGHEQVVASLEEGHKVLDREKWVLPLTSDEEKNGDKIQVSLDRVRQDYDQQYIQEWINFFRDVDVQIPANNREAIGEFKTLSTPDWPYQRLLRALADNTQFDEVRQQNEAEEQLLADGGVLDQLKQRAVRRIEARTRVRTSTFAGLLAGQKGERIDPVPEKFRSMVRFGVAPPQPKPKEGEPPRDPSPVELATYVGKLHDLAGEMGNIEDGPITADTKKATEKFEDAVKTTQGELLKMDETGQELLQPLLMNPLKQAYKAVMRHAGGAASGLWEVVVWPAYRDKIKDRYPFNLAATRDASFQDAMAFFKPKDGILWGFYGQYLRPFHTKVGHDFVPEAHLEARPRPARPFTPFRPLMYPCLKRADEITDALWPESGGGGNDVPAAAGASGGGDKDKGNDKPRVEFQINVKTVSPIVSEVIIEIDGQKRVYRNEKEFWAPMVWPGPKPTGARIQLRGAGGLDEEITREGPWGIFRLFEAGTTTAQKDKDEVFLVTWQMTAPPVSVTIEVRPVRGAHPFPQSFFRATNCPPSIGDSFGKGKG